MEQPDRKDPEQRDDRDWLRDNPEARASVERGIEDARQGRIGGPPRGYLKRRKDLGPTQ